MKQLFFLSALFFSLNVQAQSARDSNYIPGYHGKLVEMIGYQAGSVLNYIGMYMQDDFGFTGAEGPKKELPHHITMPFKPKISSNAKRNVTLRFITDKEFKITACTIDGYYSDVIKLFIEYWPGNNLNFDRAIKKETAVKYLRTDKIVLTVDPGLKTAKIDVVTNK